MELDTLTNCIQMKYSKGKIIICVCSCLVAILLAPYLLTRPFCEELSFVDTGQIGDTIGGTTAPIVGIVSIVLLAYTLIEQLRFNTKQVDLQRQEQFKTTFFELLKEQRDIKNSLFTNYEGVDMQNPTKIQKIPVKGQDFFRMGSFVLKNIFDSMEYGHYCHSYDPEEIDNQLAYCDAHSENYFEDSNGNLYRFSFETIKTQSKFCFLNDKYKITNEEFEAYKHLDIEQKINFVYGRFFNIHEECGNYFRHLYRILYFVKQSEEEELLGIYDVAVRQQVSKRYYDLVQFVQAQMSTKEMLMVFYNSFSFPKLRELLIRYNLLENLTVENLIAPSHNCIDGYHLKKQLI